MHKSSRVSVGGGVFRVLFGGEGFLEYHVNHYPMVRHDNGPAIRMKLKVVRLAAA
jgi:hypothetical protein